MYPDFYNREEIKEKIKECLAPLNIGDDMNLLARKIWMRHKETEIETRGLALEVQKGARDQINVAMLQFKIDICNVLTSSR